MKTSLLEIYIQNNTSYEVISIALNNVDKSPSNCKCAHCCGHTSRGACNPNMLPPKTPPVSITCHDEEFDHIIKALIFNIKSIF